MKPESFDLADIKRRMQGAVAALKGELSGLRTGRASANMLDPIHVEVYGQSMPLNQVATVSVPEARLLSVQVWDQANVKAVEKAIRDANLGLNPQTEGSVLRLRIPELNQERRQELVKVAHKYAEAARVAVRHVRRDGIDHLKTLKKDGTSAKTKSSVMRPTCRERPTSTSPRSTKCSGPRKRKSCRSDMI
jgi:ribosome recycling factor